MSSNDLFLYNELRVFHGRSKIFYNWHEYNIIKLNDISVKDLKLVLLIFLLSIFSCFDRYPNVIDDFLVKILATRVTFFIKSNNIVKFYLTFVCFACNKNGT